MLNALPHIHAYGKQRFVCIFFYLIIKEKNYLQIMTVTRKNWKVYFDKSPGRIPFFFLHYKGPYRLHGWACSKHCVNQITWLKHLSLHRICGVCGGNNSHRSEGKRDNVGQRLTGSLHGPTESSYEYGDEHQGYMKEKGDILTGRI